MTIPITTRAGKGSALTPTEMDTNLTNLARDSSTTVQGNIRVANQTEANALSDATLAISPNTFPGSVNSYFTLLAFLGSISITNPGYYSHPGGPLIQWGTLHIGDITGPVTSGSVTFPKLFTTVFAIIPSIQDNTSPGSSIVNVGTVSTSGFTAVCHEVISSVQDATVHWIAIGN